MNPEGHPPSTPIHTLVTYTGFICIEQVFTHYTWNSLPDRLQLPSSQIYDTYLSCLPSHTLLAISTMQLAKVLTLVTGASFSAAAPVSPGQLEASTISQLTRPLSPRDKPRDALVWDSLDGLPECWQRCMRSENNKSGVHLDGMTVDDFCRRDRKWLFVKWWSTANLIPCVSAQWDCSEDMSPIAVAWMLEMCQYA